MTFISHYVQIKPAIKAQEKLLKQLFISHYVQIKPPQIRYYKIPYNKG